MRIPLLSLIFLTPLCSILLNLDRDVVSGKCLDDQQSLLLQLKGNLTFEYSLSCSKKLAQWNQSSDCCTWDQVKCDDNGRVIRLDLGGLSINGSSDDYSSLFSLKYLEYLDLSYNFFNSRMLAKIGLVANLSNLTFLDLSGCHMYGTFPREIFQIPTLQVIDLSHNDLLQGSLPEFPKNSALQSLDLSFTSFSGGLPTSIGNLRNLSSLDLRSCNFEGALPDSMKKLTQLKYLRLSTNNFIGPIPSFNMSKNLGYIDLSHNGLTSEIPTNHWKGLLNLVEINLQNNFLNGSIPLSLFELPWLYTMYLSNNQFSGSILEFQTMSPSVLGTLDLRGNNLEGPFPTSIFKLQNLETLYLSHNKFNGTIQVESIIQGFDRISLLDLSYNNWSINSSSNNFTLLSSLRLSPLKSLYMASCNLTKFPLFLRNLSRVQTLDLSHNQIHGVIPNWIWKVGDESLGSLDLSYNYLMLMQEPYSLPDSIFSLELHNNQLHGKIPFLPPGVKYVDLSSNNFAYLIPFNSTSSHTTDFEIEFFSLSNNNLTGAIPELLCLAKNLTVLDLSNNNLSGRIPTCVTQMINLVVLNLQKNNFRGPLHPNAFPPDCKLKTLVLNRNAIHGEVPKSLANCTDLEILDLGHNKMIDEFPCFLKEISMLRALVLRSNKFHGGIGCRYANGTWPMLQIFNLAHNNFSGKLPRDLLTKWHAMMNDSDHAKVLGFSRESRESFKSSPVNPCGAVKRGEPYCRRNDQIPRSFSNSVVAHINYSDAMTVTSKGLEMELSKILTIFTYIDLSCNNFHGEIPEEVGLLKALRVLNLSNNAFTSKIPSSIGNLVQLESLDISENNLSGTIPPSLASLSFLSFLNLSFNHLVGRIPKGNQFQTFSADSFIGNEGLCGFPLNNCTSDSPSPNVTNNNDSKFGRKINWNLLSSEIGFVVGFGIIVGPLMFSKRWRKWHYERVDDIVFRIFPSSVSRKWVLWTTSR